MKWIMKVNVTTKRQLTNCQLANGKRAATGLSRQARRHSRSELNISAFRKTPRWASWGHWVGPPLSVLVESFCWGKAGALHVLYLKLPSSGASTCYGSAPI